MYRNPILLCDYSDPDVIRAGNLYFMVASSFNFTPGLPILASKDLVHWKLVNYAVENIPVARFAYPQNAQGIWAPSFSYHNGKYYIVVGMPDEGLYITEADDILGHWSPLKQIYSSKGYIDPYLFWDDDGSAWVIHAYAKSRCGFNSRLGLLKFDTEIFRCTGEDIQIFDGTETQPTIEGPKIYKRNGYYYIFAPAGGVSDGWQTVLRSKNLTGPFEEKIVLREGTSGINGPHQGALVTTNEGEDWFIHFQERGIYGRITHLEPVKWVDDWPLIGTSVKNGIVPGEPVKIYRSPKVKKTKESLYPQKNCLRAFEGASMEWQWSGNHDDNFAKFTGTPDKDVESFRLNVANVSSYAQNNFPVLWNSSNVLTRKISHENFYFKANIDASNLPVGSRAGIIFLGEEYASLAVERTETGLDLVYIKSKNKKLTDIVREEHEEMRHPIPKDLVSSALNFKMEFIPFSDYAAAVQFTVRCGGIIWPFKWKSDYFSTDNAHWVGGRFGVYAVGNGKGSVNFYNVKIRY